MDKLWKESPNNQNCAAEKNKQTKYSYQWEMTYIRSGSFYKLTEVLLVNLEPK